MLPATPTPSLRRRLMAGLMLPLLVLILLNAGWSHGRAIEVANEAHDRSLYLAARALAEELSWEHDHIHLDLQKGIGHLFENHTGARLFYRVDTLQGQWLAGNPKVPTLPQPASSATRPTPVEYFSLVQFADAQFQTSPVRLARLVHVLSDRGGQYPVVAVTVIETRETRDQLARQMLRETLLGQAVLLLAVAALVVWGIHRGIEPLERFRQQLAQREDSDFSAIEPPGLPRELHPLIDTLNSYLHRLGRLIDIRKRFLDNAAHQLRTPLTVLKTQLSLTQRATTEAQRQPLLAAAIHTTNKAVQLTEQLLSLTRAEHACETHSPEALDLVALAREVTQQRLLSAHEQGQDLGFEACVPACWIQGIPFMLREAVGNLLDNALIHGGPSIRITVRVGAHWVEVEDDGPGIAPAHQPHVFERFYSAPTNTLNTPNTPNTPGSGLGLAIVREIALQHQATLTLTSPLAHGPGTCIRLGFARVDGHNEIHGRG
ncbi:MAG: Sensor protein QseC [Pseudomonadota bacterium]|jgi:two-component system sensor histidine kinase TctE